MADDPFDFEDFFEDDHPFHLPLLADLPRPSFGASSPFSLRDSLRDFPPSDFARFCGRRQAIDPPPFVIASTSQYSSSFGRQLPSWREGAGAGAGAGSGSGTGTGSGPGLGSGSDTGATTPREPHPANRRALPTPRHRLPRLHLQHTSQPRRNPTPPQPNLTSLFSPPTHHPADRNTGLRPNSLVNLLSSPRRREPNSDDFLNELVSRDFSSPSIPSRSPRRAAQLDNSLAASNLPLLSRNTSTLLPSLAHSLSQQRVKGETPPPPDGEEPPLSLSPADSLFVSPGMSSTRPPSKRGTGSEGVALASSSRRPASPFDQLDSRGQRLPPILNITSSPQEPARKRKRDDVAEPEILKVKRNADDDNFGVDDGIKIVDLVDAVKVPAFVMDKKPKNEVKLGAFQCVICMDDVKDLTVTHCGHLFCSECLHSSLNIDVSKKICPICRQKIDSRPPNDGNFTQKAKGYYALELKLITRKSLGKRNARI